MDKKRESLQRIITSAQIYEEKLRTKNILVVLGNPLNPSYQEMAFPKTAFLHLTGVEVKMSAKEFYNKCEGKKLKLNEFELSADGTTILKLNVLPQLLNMNVNMFGTYNGKRPKLITDKLMGNVRGCLGFIKTTPNARFYTPNTTLETDIRDEIDSAERVLFILRKDKKEPLYNEIIYSAKKVNKEILKDINLVDYSKI